MTAFTPTHRAPTSGLLGWNAPESNRTVIGRVDAGAELEVLERRDSWALVRKADGATAWVEAPNLQPLTNVAHAGNPWVALLIVVVLIALLAGGVYLYLRGRAIQGEPANTFGSGFTRAPITVLNGP